MKGKDLKLEEVKVSLTLSGIRHFKSGIHSENNTKISVVHLPLACLCERYMEQVDRG